jgi:hypothetical protein
MVPDPRPPLGNKPAPLKLVSNPPQFGIDSFDLLNVSAASAPVLRVRRYGPRLAFQCPWSRGLATVHPAPVPVCDDGVLAGCAFAGFCQASLTRPIRSETRCLAGFEQLFAVN